MKDSALGQILIYHQLIDSHSLSAALRKQENLLKNSNWKRLGEILIESGDISQNDLWAALNQQEKIFDIELFSLHYHPSLKSRFKRSLDILGAITGLAIMLVLFPPIALAITTSSPGPIFITQYRVGLRGRQFKTWAFRTMVQKAKPNKANLEIPNNLRITRVGRFLRKTNLDKLPQFFNVLRGEMSLVGSRPPTLDEVKAYSQEDWQRLSIKPGITGLWQISTQDKSADLARIVELDLDYARHWQPALDLKVIGQAIMQTVFGCQHKPSNYQTKVPMLNLEIDNLSTIQLLQRLDNGVVYTPNVDHLMKLQQDPEFYRAYNHADFKICDSQILVYASHLLGNPIQERIAGSDFFPAFCQFHQSNPSIQVFILGGADGVAAEAQTNINARLGRQIIVEAYSPSFGFEEDPLECMKIVERINQCQPSVLAVCLGAPKQEKWIYRYKDQLPSVKIFLALGATVDFEAGYKPRAPQWISNMGFEWLFRLGAEPRRMWKRYLIDDLPFIGLLLQQRLGVYTPPFVVHSQHKCQQSSNLKKHYKS